MKPQPFVVLVVEDELPQRELLELMLGQAGYTVESVEDGAAALQRIEAGGLDLVLLDINIPELNGLEVARRVRESEDDVYLPIIMLTALANPGEQAAGFAAGADDYITKPFTMADVLNRVQVWTRTRQRLKLAHQRLLAQQREQRRAEQAARDEAIMVLARTIHQELKQPMAVLVGLHELRKAGSVEPAEIDSLWAELDRAVHELQVRVDVLTGLTRYETHELARLPFVDAERTSPPPR